jgi:hypothetical protein
MLFNTSWALEKARHGNRVENIENIYTRRARGGSFGRESGAENFADEEVLAY